MLLTDMRHAVERAPRAVLPELAAALWKAHAAGSIDDDEAQALAELIQARKAVPRAPETPRRIGSRPRSPASIERRRRWAGAGWMPPVLLARFTQGEAAALAVIAEDARKGDGCRLPIDRIAALAGVCRTIVKRAVRQARVLGLVTVEERRVAHWRNAPNVVRVVSAEWTTWLRIRARKDAAQPAAPGQGGGGRSAPTTSNMIHSIGNGTRIALSASRPRIGKGQPWSGLGVHAPRR